MFIGTRGLRATALLYILFGFCHERDTVVTVVLLVHVISPKGKLLTAVAAFGHFLESIAGDHQMA